MAGHVWRCLIWPLFWLRCWSLTTAAGVTLTPQMLGWVAASIIGSQLLLRVGYHTLALIGMSLFRAFGMFLMSHRSAAHRSASHC